MIIWTSSSFCSQVHSWSGADLAAAQAAADAAANLEDEDPNNTGVGQGRNGADPSSSSSASSKACGELALEVARQQRLVALRMQELDDQLKRLGGAQCLVADRNLPPGTPRLQAADAATAAFATAATAGAGAGASLTKQGHYGQANGSSSNGSPVGGGGRGLAELRKRRRQWQAAEQAEDGRGATVQREHGDGSHTDRTTSPRPTTSGDRGSNNNKGEQPARDENGELVYVVSRSQISLAVAEARRRNEEDRARLARAATAMATGGTGVKDPQSHNAEAGAGDLGGDSGGESGAAQRAAAEEAEAQRRAAVDAEDKRRLQALLSSVGPDVVHLRERRASAAAVAAEVSAKAAAAAVIAADGGDTQGLTRRRPEDGSPTGSLPHRERGMSGSENKGATTGGDHEGARDGDEETAAWALEEKKQERRRRRAERKALHEKQTNKGALLPRAVAELFRAPFPAADDA